MYLSFVYVLRWVTKMLVLKRCNFLYCRMLEFDISNGFLKKKWNINDEKTAVSYLENQVPHIESICIRIVDG